jgi:hypothetical protein
MALGWWRAPWFVTLGAWLEARRRLVWAAWVLAFGTANLIPVLWLGLPQPAIHDEFSYLLGADTFARGRLSNPPLESWENFETLYVQMQPRYASIYPPGSAFTLAAGKVVLGHPFWGLFAVNLALAAALPWALEAFVAFRHAIAASLWIGGGVACTYWTHGYWGGSLAALLGTLIVGSLGRPATGRHAAILGLAAGGLAFVRPFEGAVMMLAVAPAFALKRPPRRAWALVGAALALCLGAWLYYNYCVTGEPLVHPYFRYFREYIGKPFFFGGMGREVKFRHIEIEMMLSDLGAYADPVRTIAWKLFVFLFPLRPVAGAFVLAAGAWYAWRSRQRVLGGLVAAAALTVAYSRFAFPHYVAPYFVCVALLAAFGLRQVPRFLAVAFLVTGLAANGEAWLNMLRGRRDVRLMTVLWPRMEYPPYSLNFLEDGFVRTKAAAELDLQSRPGPHLVFVKYRPSHNPHEEWVYNGAELDEQEIVWARYYTPESRARLRARFRDRACWVLEPDVRRYRLSACD